MKAQTFLPKKTTKYNSVEQNNRILSLHGKRKTKHLSFLLRFLIICINLLTHEVSKSTLGKTMKNIKSP